MAETPVGTGWTVADLERFPDDEGHCYEIIGGELFVSKAPRDDHQVACSEIITSLRIWNGGAGLGYVMIDRGSSSA